MRPALYRGSARSIVIPVGEIVEQREASVCCSAVPPLRNSRARPPERNCHPIIDDGSGKVVAGTRPRAVAERAIVAEDNVIADDRPRPLCSGVTGWTASGIHSPVAPGRAEHIFRAAVVVKVTSDGFTGSGERGC
jgi:hypothetical protein